MTILCTTIEESKSFDGRSKLQQSQWTERHRLNVLLEAAQETRKTLLTNAVEAPMVSGRVESNVRNHSTMAWGTNVERN